MIPLEPWVLSILADPITKQPVKPNTCKIMHGIIDARVHLKNTYGYSAWEEGQIEYQTWEKNCTNSIEEYIEEIEYDKPIYEYYTMQGRILDCGGGAGRIREFLAQNIEFISTDPWLEAPFIISDNIKKAYSCLNHPLNFIAANAEFQPFLSESFDWVHMRSMLDHVQIPDLALLEALRVLRAGGRVLIGLYVQGGKNGRQRHPLDRRLKEIFKMGLSSIGINNWKDHHIWHPTYEELLKLIKDNGFVIEDTYWQPHWNNTVCYVCARKP